MFLKGFEAEKVLEGVAREVARTYCRSSPLLGWGWRGVSFLGVARSLLTGVAKCVLPGVAKGVSFRGVARSSYLGWGSRGFVFEMFVIQKRFNLNLIAYSYFLEVARLCRRMGQVTKLTARCSVSKCSARQHQEFTLERSNVYRIFEAPSGALFAILFVISGARHVSGHIELTAGKGNK